MEINKNIKDKLIIYKKRVNNLMNIFLVKYNDIFTKKELIQYDEIIDLDFKISDLYTELLTFFVEAEITVDIFRYKSIAELYTILIKAQLPDITKYKENPQFDMLYYSYLLCIMFILLPYIYEIFLINEDCKKHNINPNDVQAIAYEKLEYKIKTRKMATYLKKDMKIFSKFDEMTNRINGIGYEKNEKHLNLQRTYIVTNNKFNELFNLFYMLSLDMKDMKKLNAFIQFFNYWYLIVILFVIFIVVLTVTLVLTLKK